VTADNDVTVVIHWGSPKVDVAGFALMIDRRRRDYGEPPTVTGKVKASAQAVAS
jgi:hypothetical protein